jgi:hypothetical protein
MAPGVTFWDAGEFIAAAHSFGIPHPPGTPLFVLLLHTWALPWSDQWYAIATNSFSLLCTVSAAGLSATVVARWFGERSDARFATAAGISAAICAGAMSTAWSNATETEVYAASLALAMITIYAADRSGRGDDRGWRVLVAYCFGIAAPLHVSALVAAPAAIFLVATNRDGMIRLVHATTMLSAATLGMAIGTQSLIFAIVTAAMAVGSARLMTMEGWRARATASEIGSLLGATILGATPLLIMLARARFDPGINQGNPSTVHALLDVIGRRQYEVSSLWPRRAPLWLQLANWFEYADWQSALSLAPSVMPTVQRVLASCVVGGLAIYGSAAHRRVDQRSWRALIVLLVCGSIGVAIYLNMLASPSFGWGILPPGSDHEARERDYFFVLSFWAIGLWAGIGAVALARKWRWPLASGFAVGAAMIALNWNAVSRRKQPEARLPETVARALLEPLPPDAVLFAAGDNDTYSLWYAQQVLHLRRDVTVVTLPLLGAGWYDDEIQRRNPTMHWKAVGDPAPRIAEAARLAHRPVVAALTLTAFDRRRVQGCWKVIGFASLDVAAGGCGDDSTLVSIDVPRTKEWVGQFGAVARAMHPEPSLDPIRDYFARMLQCPAKLLGVDTRSGRGVSLDSICNP